jgi:hypothetical protein
LSEARRAVPSHARDAVARAAEQIATLAPLLTASARRVCGAQLCAPRAKLGGAALLSGVDLGSAFDSPDTGQAVEEIDEHVGTGAGLHILTGTSPRWLAATTIIDVHQ